VKTLAPEIAGQTLQPGDPEDVGMSRPRVRHLSTLVKGWVDGGDPQAAVVLVARRGTIVLHEAFGKLTHEPGSPPAPLDTVFPLASITKLLTATALMTLVEEGRVGLNRRVREYIPEFAGEGKDAVLVQHLLTHTSGLDEEVIEAFAGEKGEITVPPGDTMHTLARENLLRRYDCPLSKPPGIEMSYCDFGFELAMDIVCRVTGRSLDRFAAERIFQPLGMRDTYYCRVDVPRDRRAGRPLDPAVDPATDAIVESQRVYQGSTRSWSTAMDMAIFCQTFLNKGAYGNARILSPVAALAMTSNQIPGIRATWLDEEFPEASWGFGWSVHGNKTGWCGGLYSPEAFEHWGAGGTYVWADPVYDLVGVFFTVSRIPVSEGRNYRHPWRNDLFTDAATAAVVE
jgi:CubicO group peptidase (beta-lactamase class C family)